MAERIARNNTIFREANEKIREKSMELGDPVERIPFLCECPKEDCATIVPLTPAEYEAVRGEPMQLLHDAGPRGSRAALGEVVYRRERYVVVQKDVKRN